MNTIKSHYDLEVWKKSIELVKNTYSLTKCYPKDERFILVSQMRRSAISVSSNIAEGAGRRSPKEFANFLNIALGSIAELDTQFIISKELNYLENILEIQKQIKLIRIMISSLIRKL